MLLKSKTSVSVQSSGSVTPLKALCAHHLLVGPEGPSGGTSSLRCGVPRAGWEPSCVQPRGPSAGPCCPAVHGAASMAVNDAIMSLLRGLAQGPGRSAVQQTGGACCSPAKPGHFWCVSVPTRRGPGRDGGGTRGLGTERDGVWHLALTASRKPCLGVPGLRTGEQPHSPGAGAC